ncbi:MAG: hypothetical protein ACRDTT_31210 [Pseudonocardiaceae bacterium]
MKVVVAGGWDTTDEKFPTDEYGLANKIDYLRHRVPRPTRGASTGR